MKKILVLLLIASLQFFNLNACTTFFINKDGRLIFGRNYDWVSGAGMVCTNLSGLLKSSMKTPDGETISWISRYGSITFNQYGKEFPTGGMNEKGLVVELMWLDETKYPAADKRPALDVLQWIQYQLDNCSTIEEVIETDKKIRIASVENPPIHYLVADAKGHASTIEFLNGKLVVHREKELPQPVLTNSIYDESIKAYKNTTVSDRGGSAFAYGNNSLERFGKACSMIEQLKTGTDKPLTDYAFDILSAVAQGDFTKWSIVYDIGKKTIHFKTNSYKQIKTVSFSAFDFNCMATAKAWDMNQPGTGNINALFENFSTAANKKIIEKAAKESRKEVPISEKGQEALWKYAEGVKCN